MGPLLWAIKKGSLPEALSRNASVHASMACTIPMQELLGQGGCHLTSIGSLAPVPEPDPGTSVSCLPAWMVSGSQAHGRKLRPHNISHAFSSVRKIEWDLSLLLYAHCMGMAAYECECCAARQAYAKAKRLLKPALFLHNGSYGQRFKRPCRHPCQKSTQRVDFAALNKCLPNAILSLSPLSLAAKFSLRHV